MSALRGSLVVYTAEGGGPVTDYLHREQIDALIVRAAHRGANPTRAHDERTACIDAALGALSALLRAELAEFARKEAP